MELIIIYANLSPENPVSGKGKATKTLWVRSGKCWWFWLNIEKVNVYVNPRPRPFPYLSVLSCVNVLIKTFSNVEKYQFIYIKGNRHVATLKVLNIQAWQPSQSSGWLYNKYY